MSDDESFPPPPPPPDLHAPPGYAAYEPGMAPGALGLRSISGPARGSLIAVGITAGLGLLGTLLNLAAVGTAEDFLDGQATTQELNDAVAPGGMVLLLSGVAQITAAVFTCIWLARVLANHRQIQRHTTWSGGWGAGGWFLPPFIFVIPLLMLREAWKASAPDVPADDQRWKQTADNPIVWIWWILYGVIPVVFIPIIGFSTFGGFGDEEAVAEALRDNATLQVVQYALLIPAAIAWFLLVRQLSARHEQVTGLDRR